MEQKKSIYHEKQSKALCALHTLNNLMQKSHFTKSDLDDICEKLTPRSWLNPHRSVFGLGNYDVNVIMKALAGLGLDLIWFDKRKPLAMITYETLFGIILNIPADSKLGQILQRKHWLCIKKIGNNYYNLDSKLEAPLLIGEEKVAITFLNKVLNSEEKEIFLVVRNGEPWRRKSSGDSGISGITIDLETCPKLDIVNVGD